jgi:hypothetical protein
MYPPQSYDLPPLRPDLFGALPRDPRAGPPQAGGPPPQGGEAPMDMNKYLIDKVMEIKSRMGGGGPGALGAISEAMMQQPQGGEIPPQQNMMA